MGGGLAKSYLVVLSLAWILPAWCFGASTVSGQCLLLVLAGAALLLAWMQRRSRGREPDLNERDALDAGLRSRSGNKARWAYAGSVLFLCYVLVQALNPAFGFERGWPVGRLFEIPHVAWLPSGMATPFSASAAGGGGAVPCENSWRYLLIFSGAAMLVWATAAGVHQTGLLRRWLEVMFVHAVVFSVVAIVHNVSGSRLTYWLFYDPANRLGGPQFPNGNQQGAYQVILLAITLAAARVGSGARPFAALRWRRRLMLAAPAIVWLGCVSGRHRAGILLGTALVVFALLQIWWRARSRVRLKIAVLAVCGAAVLATGVSVAPPLRETFGRFAEFRDAPALLLRGGNFRTLQHEVAWGIFGDARAFGRGGGCYLYLFNEYYRRVPELAAELDAQKLNRVVFPHADGDWQEFLAEYGIAGMALFVMPLMCWLAWLLPRWRRARAGVWMLAAGVACVLAQATIDPVFRNPVVLATTACAAWLAAQLHHARGIFRQRARGRG